MGRFVSVAGSWRRHGMLPLAGAIGWGVLLGWGCSAKPLISGKFDDGAALASIERAAEEQSRSPIAPPAEWRPPPGLEPSEVAPVAPEERDRAGLSLDEVTRRLIESSSADTRSAAAEPGRARVDRDAALRRYIAGREALLLGDAARATEELSAATKLDPDSPEPWRVLGEARGLARDRIGSMTALQAAAKRGMADARALDFLGRNSLAMGDAASAAAYYARAAAVGASPTDPNLTLAIGHGYARALERLGYIEASRQAMEPLARPGAGRAGRGGDEARMLSARRGMFARLIGDAHARLGRPADALAAYEAAAEIDGFDPVPILPRMVDAACRAGQPARASALVMQDLRGAGERDDRLAIALLGYVVRTADAAADRPGQDSGRGTWRRIGEGVRAAVADQRARAVMGGTAADRSRWVRAQAAVSEPREGAALLRESLASEPRDPHDERAVELLLKMTPDADAAFRDAADRAAASPMSAPRYAQWLLERGDEPAVMSAAERASGGAPSLVAAYVLAELGLVNEAAIAAARAAGPVEDIRKSAPMRTAATLARVRFLGALGRAGEAAAAAERIDPSAGDVPRRARAQALAALQRPSEGLEVIRPLADRPEADAEDLLAAAEIAAATGVPSAGDEAERWLGRVAERWPWDERPYAGRLSAVSLEMLVEAQPPTEAWRRLQKDIPGARAAERALVLSRLEARDFKGALAPAEALTERGLSDEASLSLLDVAWTAVSKDDPAVWERAAAWLEKMRLRRPAAPTLAGLQAHVLSRAGRAADAELVLRKQLAATGSADVSRLLESLLRNELKRGTEADELAAARLGASPAGIAEAIELAEIHVRRERYADAIDALRPMEASGVAPTPKQLDQLAVIAAAMARAADSMGDAPTRSAALWLLDRLAQTGQRLPLDLHRARLAMLAQTPDADGPRVGAAAKRAADEYPIAAARLYAEMIDQLAGAGREGEALPIIAGAASGDAAGDPLLMTIWATQIARHGSASDGRAMIERASEAGSLGGVVLYLVRGGPPERPGPHDPREVERLLRRRVRDLRAEAAYQLANLCNARRREAEAVGLDELALEYEPTHAWASNDLGYSLADKGVDLPRAERLLLQALKALPREASVVDSVGWLRYKQNRLRDEVSEDGEKLEGAITLLRRAAQLQASAGEPHAAILEHLGDAHWSAGNQDEARRVWARASDAAENQLSLAVKAKLPPALLKPLADDARRLREKLAAVERGTEPVVAPKAEAPDGGQ